MVRRQLVGENVSSYQGKNYALKAEEDLKGSVRGAHLTG